MKRQVVAGITVIACAALCANLWTRSAEVEDLPAEPIKAATNAEIEPRLEETPRIILSADSPVFEAEPVTESEPEETDITSEKETEKPAPQMAQRVKPTASSPEPHMGDVRVVDGEKQVYIAGFGWIKDESGGSVGTMVGNPSDELTSNNVSMGGGTIVDGKGDINKMVGIMGGSESPPSNTTPPGSEPPEPVDGEIHIVFAEAPEKNSVPPPYKPTTTPLDP